MQSLKHKLISYCGGLAIVAALGCTPKADPSLGAPIERPKPALELDLAATASAPNGREIYVSVLDSSPAKILRIRSLSVDAFEDTDGNRIGKMENFSWRYQPDGDSEQSQAQGPIELRMIFRSSHRGSIGRLSGTMQLTTGVEKQIQVPVQSMQQDSATTEELDRVGLKLEQSISSKVGITLVGENVAKIKNILLMGPNEEAIEPNLRSGGSTRFTWGWYQESEAPEKFVFRISLPTETVDCEFQSTQSRVAVRLPELNLDGLLTRMDFMDVNVEGPKDGLLDCHILDSTEQIVSTKPRRLNLGLNESWSFSAAVETAESLRIKIGENPKDLAIDFDLQDIEIR
ncbi:MAG: hypothetical protein AAGG44_00590 [Planctomycetota bacterium]